MPIFLYNIFLVLYRATIRIAANWNIKARKWIDGRKNIFEKIQSSVQNSASPVIWVHCSSLGEFEQGRPVMEKLRVQVPGSRLFVTFFSPSGYEVKKNDAVADHIFYLPMDSKKNAAKFLDIIKPSLVIFVKYDYWYYYLDEIKKRKIRCLLISAVFRKEQSFFKWYGGLQRKMLGCFMQLFVQDKESKELLKKIGIENCTVSGDTRFDRVVEIAEKFEPIVSIEKILEGSKCIVAGSTWKEDEEVLKSAWNEIKSSQSKLIIAPHEIHPERLKELSMLFPGTVYFSSLVPGSKTPADVIIIDNIGMLSRLYKYAHVTYVGGGFTKDGVHNVLEAAVYGKPVIFGPNYEKYKEATDLIAAGGAESITNKDELLRILFALFNHEDENRKRSECSKNYVMLNTGATERIIHYIQENRLLTS